jgi:8-oxo-dGTP diphosphatase
MIIPSVGIVAFKDQQVLLVRHGETAGHITGMYGLPGGRFEEGETAIQAAKREFEEETQLVVAEGGLISFPENMFFAKILRKDGTIKEFSFEIFLCTNFSGEISGTEETQPEWVDINKMNQLNLLPNIKEAVQKALEFRKSL